MNVHISFNYTIWRGRKDVVHVFFASCSNRYDWSCFTIPQCHQTKHTVLYVLSANIAWLWNINLETIKCCVCNIIVSLIIVLDSVSATIHIKHMSRLMTKPTKWWCAQRRLRSAWVSAQSDQNLHSFCWFCDEAAHIKANWTAKNKLIHACPQRE